MVKPCMDISYRICIIKYLSQEQQQQNNNKKKLSIQSRTLNQELYNTSKYPLISCKQHQKKKYYVAKKILRFIPIHASCVSYTYLLAFGGTCKYVSIQFHLVCRFSLKYIPNNISRQSPANKSIMYVEDIVYVARAQQANRYPGDSRTTLPESRYFKKRMGSSAK